MKQILILFFILITTVSCIDNTPIEYTCFKFNEADSIIDNYSNKNKELDFEEFTTLFDFKLCKSREFNKKIFEKKLKESYRTDSLLSINERIKPFYVTFKKFKDKDCEINFHSFQRDKNLRFPENYNFLSDNDLIVAKAQNELKAEIINKGYNKKATSEESLSSNFNNLLLSLTKKYGTYSFKEGNEFTKTVYKTYDDEVVYTNYYWIVNNTLISLKYQHFSTNKKFRDYNDITVETSSEDVNLIYENISLNKQRKLEVINAYESEVRKQYEKENAVKINYENSKNSLDKKDQQDIESKL